MDVVQWTHRNSDPSSTTKADLRISIFRRVIHGWTYQVYPGEEEPKWLNTEKYTLSQKKKRFLIIYLLHHIDRFNFWWTHLEHCVGFLEQLDLVLRRFVDWFIDSWLIHVFSISTWLFFKFIINKKKPCWLNSRYISSCIIWHIKVRLWVTYKWHFSYVSNFYYFYFYNYFKIISIKSFLTDVVMLDQSTFSSSPLPVFFSVSTNWFRFKFTTFFWCSTPSLAPWRSAPGGDVSIKSAFFDLWTFDHDLCSVHGLGLVSTTFAIKNLKDTKTNDPEEWTHSTWSSLV